jgi:hypothetical protein
VDRTVRATDAGTPRRATVKVSARPPPLGGGSSRTGALELGGQPLHLRPADERVLTTGDDRMVEDALIASDLIQR